MSGNRACCIVARTTMLKGPCMKHLNHVLLMLAMSSGAAAHASEADHREFEATLHVPYRATLTEDGTPQEARTFTLEFSYPHVQRTQSVFWLVELLGPDGETVQRWHGVERLFKEAVQVQVDWSAHNGRAAMPEGLYRVRMRAVAQDARTLKGNAEDAVLQALAAAGEEAHEQEWELAVGNGAAPAMPAFRAMPTGPASAARARAEARAAGAAPQRLRQGAAPATASLPYTVYFGNLHSQTNHSDGGGALASCTGAQAPQSAAYGPNDAYAYAKNRGLDFLLASEHNHMYDGSDATNTSADAAAARALYQSGLNMAGSYSSANPGFLALYGQEWGVINNGGHLNILNANELLGWESNSGGQLLADTLTAKGDYAALYTLMRQRGWLGQFNHPATSGQFAAGGVALGYTADGDQAMALCEVLNTSAFSTNTTETETGRSNYEGACRKALEAGFHVAFSTNQDNHCANWGASYTNRTGVLIPTGTPLSSASFMEAIRARRVFATMDKASQLVLTANGHVMGERFSNSGALQLQVNFANSAGKTASTVQIFEGVPGRNGTVTQLSSSASTTITPSNGEHFYYAKVTQNDGNILWSAPVWVSQGGVVEPPPPQPQQLILNGGFESGAASWTASSGVITNNAGQAAHGGSYKAWLNGYGAAHTDTLYQQVAIPAAAASATLSFWLKVASDETTTTTAYDTLKVQVRSSSGAVLATLATYSNLNKSGSYAQKTFSLDAWKGQTVRIHFEGIEGSTVQTSFLVDDVALNVQ